MPLTEFFIIFTLGLVSSLHCVQMCGPLVVALSLPFSQQPIRQQLFAQLSYHAGRLVTYTLLGAAAGLLGHSVTLMGQLAGAQNLAAVVAGVLMLVAGLVMLDLVPVRQWQRFDPLGVLSKTLKPLGARIAAPTVSSKFGLGLMLGLLPCGLIYAALLKALATGSVAAGSLTMSAFGLGTVSALLGLSLFSTTLTRQFAKRTGSWGSRLTAVSVMMLGAVLLWRGLSPLIVGTMAHAAPGHHH